MDLCNNKLVDLADESVVLRMKGIPRGPVLPCDNENIQAAKRTLLDQDQLMCSL